MNGFTSDLLAGRTYLVTGASSGIGGAVAAQIAACGGCVLANGRDPERLRALLTRLAPGSHQSVPQALDDADEVAEWCKGIALERQGIDGIFHGAGVELVLPARLTKTAQIQALFGSSVSAALGLARASGSKGVLREPGAALVFMSSVAGLRGQSGMVAYSAAKAAIDGMVRSLACELAPRGIRVNSIAAGAVRTEMHARLTGMLGPTAVADYESRHLLGFGEPADVAAAAVYLLSSLSRWVTGATWVVDGGYTAR